MSTQLTRMIFVNLSVRDLQASKGFFAKLGFEFNQQFTDDTAAAMPINEHAVVMLLVEPKFKTFTRREICDTRTHTEALVAISCQSRAEVDDLTNKALAAGGKPAMDAQDHGFMYGRSFYDLDGHHWEVMWMDPAVVQK
ncbi:MAG: VOC family protein [Kofleriaceae bacterium]